MRMPKLLGAAALAAGMLGLGSQVQAANPATATITPQPGGIPGWTIVRNADTADEVDGTEIDFEVRYNYYDVNSDILRVINPNTRNFKNTLTWDCDGNPYDSVSKTGTTEGATDLLYYTCPFGQLCNFAEAKVEIL